MMRNTRTSVCSVWRHRRQRGTVGLEAGQACSGQDQTRTCADVVLTSPLRPEYSAEAYSVQSPKETGLPASRRTAMLGRGDASPTSWFKE